jgi:hypothetical protein
MKHRKMFGSEEDEASEQFMILYNKKLLDLYTPVSLVWIVTPRRLACSYIEFVTVYILVHADNE